MPVNALESKNSLGLAGKDDEKNNAMTQEEILAMIAEHPELQRYIDRRVTDGIKTFAANQKKKAEDENPEADAMKGGKETGGNSTNPKPETKSQEINDEPAPKAATAQTELAEPFIEEALAARGLGAFAGLVETPEQLSALEQAAYSFLQSQNLGSDFAMPAIESPPANLSPLEVHIANRLGIRLEGYVKNKNEINSKKGTN